MLIKGSLKHQQTVWDGKFTCYTQVQVLYDTEIPSLVVMAAVQKIHSSGVIALCVEMDFYFFGKSWTFVLSEAKLLSDSFPPSGKNHKRFTNLETRLSPEVRPDRAHRIHHDAKGQRTTKPQWDCSCRRRWHPPFCYHLTVDEYHDERLQFGGIYSRGMVGAWCRNSWRVGPLVFFLCVLFQWCFSFVVCTERTTGYVVHNST